MKVRNTEKFKKFSNVKLGDTFTFQDVVYIKMSRELRTGSGAYNCLRLSTGEPLWFAGDSQVVEKEFEATPVQ